MSEDIMSMLHGIVLLQTAAQQSHQSFLDLVQAELDGFNIRDINNVQSLILFSIGDTEKTVCEVTMLGCHVGGTNVADNINNLIEAGYLVLGVSTDDVCAKNLQLTEKGRKLHARLGRMQAALCGSFAETLLTETNVDSVTQTLRRLDQVWNHARVTRTHPSQFAAFAYPLSYLASNEGSSNPSD
jgi:DNA-binding MarR family transcriptional regulator